MVLYSYMELSIILINKENIMWQDSNWEFKYWIGCEREREREVQVTLGITFL